MQCGLDVMSTAQLHAVIASPITLASFHSPRFDAYAPVLQLPVFAHRPMGTQF